MNDRVKELFAQAQQLSPQEQAELLDLLLALHSPALELHPDWVDEIERRVARLDGGQAQLYDANEVLAELRAKCG